jgi:hypothetical protein
MEQVLEFLRGIEIIDLIIGVGVVLLVWPAIKVTLRRRKLLKKFKQEKAELEANKCKGAHNWMEMELMGEKTHVCRDCYWSPKHNEFVRKIFVDAEIEHQKFVKELEKYKKQRIEELAAKYFMEPEDLKIVAEEILKINKDFTTQHLDKKIREMLGQSLEEVKIEEV